MKRKQIFRSGVVLLELMAAILIFALAGAVCVQVLMKADAMADQAQALSDGVNYASSAAEIFRAAETEDDAYKYIETLWPQAKTGAETTVAFPEGQLTILRKPERELRIYHIQWEAGGEVLYELELHRHYPEVSL